MATITVPYKIMAKGFTLSGDTRSGYTASVPYLVDWVNAYRFIDDVIGNPEAIIQGPITWRLPLRFPGSNAPIYCTGFSCAPCGVDGDAPPPGATAGLAPGEFFSHAVITLSFGTPTAIQGFDQDDPQAMTQIDPENPITLCEQSIKINGKTQTFKGFKYKYDDFPLKRVDQDFARPFSEVKLIFKFPKVPYLPWNLIKPYINRVNSVRMGACDAETLLFEGMGTEIKYTIQLTGSGQSRGIAQSVTLEFAYEERNWNKLPLPDGSWGYVYYGASTSNRIYEKADFRQIFNTLQFQAATA